MSGRPALKRPYATSAAYDPACGRVRVEMSDGGHFEFVARTAQDMDRATDDQLANIVVEGLGSGLHWPDLDVDFSVEGLRQGILGSRAFMNARTPRQG